MPTIGTEDSSTADGNRPTGTTPHAQSDDVCADVILEPVRAHGPRRIHRRRVIARQWSHPPGRPRHEWSLLDRSVVPPQADDFRPVIWADTDLDHLDRFVPTTQRT